MEDAHLTVEYKADILWSEGFTLPDVVECRYWKRWVNTTYRNVTNGEESWQQQIKQVGVIDSSRLFKTLANRANGNDGRIKRKKQ